MKEKLFMKACALLFVTLFFIGCSGGGGSSSTKASLSGTVYDSSSSSGGGIFKAGVKNKSYATETSSSKLPVSGANVLVFDLDSTSTAAAATTTTDSDGVWSTEIDAGHYIVFAVYLDLNTFTLKTARVDDVTAEEGKAVAVDDQVVATDETAPTIVSILDDTVATTNSDGQNVYEPSSIPASSKIAIYFNESMSSTSIESALSLKEQVKNSDGEFVDGNAVDYSMENNGSLTEFRLIPTDGLTIGVTYKLTVASTAKDLANNQLGTTAIAAIEVMTAKEASEAFSIIYTKPAGSDTDVPVSAAISMAFNFPADFASFKQNFTITPALEGRIEIMGKTATFFPKGMMASETEYSVTVGAGVQDLSGNTLGEDYAFSFTTGTPLIFSDDQNALDIANIIGKFQAAMESGNFSALLHLLTPGFVAEEWDRETGELMKMDAARFVEMLKEETSKQMGFGDIERIRIKEIANPTNTILAEHYKNSNGYDLYRGFVPIKWAEFDFAHPQTDSNGNTIIPVKSGGDVIGVEKEVTDQWSGDKWMENFTYILAGGKFDSGNCATGQVTASIPKHDEFGRQVMDDTNGEPVMIQVTFTAVDGDCDDTNSWSDANDSNPGNNPWPQDGDTDPKNDPIPHNDSNLDEGLRDKVVSDDELWSSSESYYVVDASGGWQGVVNQDLKLTEINGPLGWPCTRFVQDAFGGSEVIDNNADGECDGDNDAGYDLTRVFVDESGN
ncbi:MAG: Ig-like domain-containing protein, partial [Nitrospirota bacterium]